MEERKFSEQELVRREKMQELIDKGIDPFGQRFDVTAYSKGIKEQYGDKTHEELEEMAVEVSVASHEMEKNLDQSGQQQQNEQQNNATGSIQRIRRANINLNLYNSEEEALEEASGLDDAARIAMEMMAANGNTMDLLA